MNFVLYANRKLHVYEFVLFGEMYLSGSRFSGFSISGYCTFGKMLACREFVFRYMIPVGVMPSDKYMSSKCKVVM